MDFLITVLRTVILKSKHTKVVVLNASLSDWLTVLCASFSGEIRNNCMIYMSSNMNKFVKTDNIDLLHQEVMLESIQGATAKINLG